MRGLVKKEKYGGFDRFFVYSKNRTATEKANMNHSVTGICLNSPASDLITT